jgi:hypothetical protein
VIGTMLGRLGQSASARVAARSRVAEAAASKERPTSEPTSSAGSEFVW